MAYSQNGGNVAANYATNKMAGNVKFTPNYCTFRTINVPRDTYNTKILNYQLLQDQYVHYTARKELLGNQAQGHVGCLGCDHTKPICPTQTGHVFGEVVGTESRLKGL